MLCFPIQITLVIYLLWRILGLAVLAIVGTLILLCILCIICRHYISFMHVQQMLLKDKRVKVMNDILNGIKVIKLNAWEPCFMNTVNSIRFKELKYLFKEECINSVLCSSCYYSTSIIILIVYPTYVLLDLKNALRAEVVFVTLSYIAIFQFTLVGIHKFTRSISQSLVSLRRLSKYFVCDEFSEGSVQYIQDKCYALKIENATFSWNPHTSPILNDINLDVKTGALVAVIGQVGAGKSSLISTILGEMEKVTGTVTISDSIAYVSQQAWLLNDTIKNNILFGKSFHSTFYEKVIQSCALKTDLDILPAGDETEIGDRGIILSGGQKQRVSLARAVYSEAGIYLLDDPLSAVDVHVGAHLFNEVIGPNGLLREKTRILVTHNVTYLPQMDLIVVMKEGMIADIGTYQDMMERKGSYAETIFKYLAFMADENRVREETEQDELAKKKMFANDNDVFVSNRIHTESDTSTTKNVLLHPESKVDIKSDSSVQRGKLTVKETVEFGQVKFSTYLYYAKLMGSKVVSLFLLLHIIAYGCYMGMNLWLSQWTNDEINDDGTQDLKLRNFRLRIFLSLGVAYVFFIFLSVLLRVYGITMASKRIHYRLLHNVLRLSMSFFEMTPLGRIMNRFSRDIDLIDIEMPDKITVMIFSLFEIVLAMLLICIANPIFLTTFIPTAILSYFFLCCYLATARQVKRLESVTRSPVYSHMSETINGASIIRAFRKQDHFISQSGRKMDKNSMCHYLFLTGVRWNGMWQEMLGNILILCATVLLVMNRNALNPGLVGMSISCALSTNGILNRLVRTAGELEFVAVAVERVKEYTSFRTEGAWSVSNKNQDPNWPFWGKIGLNGYCTRYRQGLDYVLRYVTCNINSGEKVGIVGRTGSGKSSLALALFRIIEAADGSIVIDGEDISQIGLHDLRSKLTIIPQDPFLFVGTVRSNVDPSCLHSDDDVWHALELAHSKSFVEALPGGLLHEISEGGHNLSVGQRQLVCLSRAVLKKNKILVLDEVTASVDIKTDALIQKTIREEFADCTILTIAHRLNTVMDSDRIMVMENGAIVEFESPSKLLQDKSSEFYRMAKEANLI